MRATAITDNYNRTMDYLRISVTDRCNLRCSYCMPSEKTTFLPKSDILNYSELHRLINLFTDLGIQKIRFTGGEPFMRNAFVLFLKEVRASHPLLNIHITTNGVLTHRYINELIELRLSGINISLDTLDSKRFFEITRRDKLSDVLLTIQELLKTDIQIKLNTVIQQGLNEDEIIPLINHYKKAPLHLRFIEHMPFTDSRYTQTKWTGNHILNSIENSRFKLNKLQRAKNSTCTEFRVQGAHPQFKLGIIEGFSRTFCGSCNRIRLTATGLLKTCVYADPSSNLKLLLGMGLSDEELKMHLNSVISQRYENGFEAQQNRKQVLCESMSKIGG